MGRAGHCWGTPCFAMRFLSLSCHICVHATSVKLLGHVTGTSLAPTPSHTLSLSLFNPPMASHRTLLLWVRACYPCNCDPSRVFLEGISALGCILSHELSKLPHLGQADGLQETCCLLVGHSCHWDEVFWSDGWRHWPDRVGPVIRPAPASFLLLRVCGQAECH